MRKRQMPRLHEHMSFTHLTSEADSENRRFSESLPVMYSCTIFTTGGTRMVGRNTELKELAQAYAQFGNQLIVLYGRRGIGKRELLKEFLQDKKYVYYTARQASPKLQRQFMGREIEKKYQIKLQDFEYDTFFARIRSGDASKLVLVVEDFEYIAKKDPDFMESIGKLKDKRLYPGPVMIILCSSAIAWVENDMVGCLGACARKVTGVRKLSELGFVDVVHLLPDYGVRECIQVYGILGGVSSYLKRWDASKSLKENICCHILSEDGFLYREAETYTGESLRELSIYNTILEALAAGKSKLNDLYAYTGFSRAKISVYLKNLMALDIAERVNSFETGGWENAQKGLYGIRDTYIHFWYRFVYPNLTDLHLMNEDDFFDAYIGPELEEYLNDCFRNVCMEYLRLMSMVKQLPIQIHRMGTWVGKQGSIDIIAQNAVREYIVGLCNWSEEFLTEEMYRQLLAGMKQAKIKAKKYYLFSAKDFTPEIHQLAEENEDIVLVDMNHL